MNWVLEHMGDPGMTSSFKILLDACFKLQWVNSYIDFQLFLLKKVPYFSKFLGSNRLVFVLVPQALVQLHKYCSNLLNQ